MTQDEFDDILEVLRERQGGGDGYRSVITEEVIQKTVAKLRETDSAIEVAESKVVAWTTIKHLFRPAVALPLAAAAVVLLFFGLYVFGTGFGSKPIVLMATLTRAGSSPANARLEFRSDKRTFTLSENGLNLVGNLQPIVSEGPDISAFQANASGTNAQGQAVSLKGTLRLTRLEGRDKIRSKADLTGAAFTGTRQVAGQPEETLNLNFSATD